MPLRFVTMNGLINCDRDGYPVSLLWVAGYNAADQHYHEFGFYIIPDPKSDFGKGFNYCMCHGE